ncbi:two pore domain potassium channel family protein [Phytoactinopolyspora alkaliphila]|uniref:Two pore domain potassium channel family protein n=1 Tax=Phytoactinopolyspora alkaliphila TaxID=1783498 RepID=A0A6N9YH79_9ACTN|nr:two pore domain potassium channel family protein [Phytoactinopolyspora alkaliphila]
MAIIVLGVMVTLLVVRDVWQTVLHPDAEGMVAALTRRAMWRLATGAGIRLRFRRRRILALAGPGIVVLTFVAWMGLLTLGLTLVFWPMGDQFASDPALGSLTFLDTFYYVGGTVTVLGFGDITPISGLGKLLTISAAALGFTMFTAMASYLIEVVNGLSARDRFTLAIHDETRGRTGDVALAEFLAYEGADETRKRCRVWAAHLRGVDEMVHRYPLVALTYRSRRAEYDPEPALRRCAEAAAAALVAVRFEPALRSAADELATAMARLERTIAENYLADEVVRRLSDAEPEERDLNTVDEIHRLLAERLGPHAASVATDGHAGEAVFRARVFLSSLRDWSRADVSGYEWGAGSNA